MEEGRSGRGVRQTGACLGDMFCSGMERVWGGLRHGRRFDQHEELCSVPVPCWKDLSVETFSSLFSDVVLPEVATLPPVGGEGGSAKEGMTVERDREKRMETVVERWKEGRSVGEVKCGGWREEPCALVGLGERGKRGEEGRQLLSVFSGECRGKEGEFPLFSGENRGGTVVETFIKNAVWKYGEEKREKRERGDRKKGEGKAWREGLFLSQGSSSGQEGFSQGGVLGQWLFQGLLPSSQSDGLSQEGILMKSMGSNQGGVESLISVPRGLGNRESFGSGYEGLGLRPEERDWGERWESESMKSSFWEVPCGVNQRGLKQGGGNLGLGSSNQGGVQSLVKPSFVSGGFFGDGAKGGLDTVVQDGVHHCFHDNLKIFPKRDTSNYTQNLGSNYAPNLGSNSESNSAQNSSQSYLKSSHPFVHLYSNFLSNSPLNGSTQWYSNHSVFGGTKGAREEGCLRDFEGPSKPLEDGVFPDEGKGLFSHFIQNDTRNDFQNEIKGSLHEKNRGVYPVGATAVAHRLGTYGTNSERGPSFVGGEGGTYGTFEKGRNVGGVSGVGQGGALVDVSLGSKHRDLPAYANGGMIGSPHVGLVGEAGPEAIIPLSSERRSRGLALWEEAGQRLGVSMYSKGGMVGTGSSGTGGDEGAMPYFGEVERGMGAVVSLASAVRSAVSDSGQRTSSHGTTLFQGADGGYLNAMQSNSVYSMGEHGASEMGGSSAVMDRGALMSTSTESSSLWSNISSHFLSNLSPNLTSFTSLLASSSLPVNHSGVQDSLSTISEMSMLTGVFDNVNERETEGYEVFERESSTSREKGAEVSVPVNIGTVSLQVQGGGSSDVLGELKGNLADLTDEIASHLATSLQQVFSNMPLCTEN